MNKHTEQLMDYLYGEMAPEEIRGFEQTLEKDPALQAELKQLRQMQHLMPGWKDRQVPSPTLVIAPRKGGWRSWLDSSWVKAAAAILLLMGMAAAMGMYVQWDKNTLSIGFGAAPDPADELRQEWLQAQAQQQQEMQAWMRQQWQAERTRTEQELGLLKSGISGQLATLEREMRRQTSPREGLNPAQLAALRKDLLDENYQMLTQLVALSQNQQKAYTEALLADFSSFLERQRTEDLRLMAVALNDVLEQNHIQQSETEQLLAQLITEIKYDNQLNPRR